MTLVPQHSICYWLDGQIEEQFVTHGKETEAFTPEEKGYCFDGWYTSKELDARFCDAGERISVSENMTLYGKWTTNKKSYTITYDFGDYDDVIALVESDAMLYIWRDSSAADSSAIRYTGSL